jgi:hypothetical protein
MDIVEQFIRQVSYKFPKGYPDLSNEADRKLLFELFEAEAAAAPKDRSIYDKIAAKVLTGDENGEIPQPSRVYSVGKNINLSGEDERIFSKLYPIAPPKSGKELDTAGSKGSGNGEIAMHWLLSRGHTVVDSRGSDNPDLIVDGDIGLEVKAYETTTMTLGRYGSDKDNIAILGVVFGVSTLVGTFQGGKRTAGTMTFNTPELLEAFKRLSDFDQSDLRTIAGDYALIQNIYNNIDSVKEALNIEGKITPEHGTAEMLRRLIATKLTKKPGIGGYLVNVSQKGSIKYTQITQELIDSLSDEQLLKGVSTNQGALNIITNTLFPS